jgi:muramoyltetrapeptide carboxypeptidase
MIKTVKSNATIGIYSPSGSVVYSDSDTALYERGLEKLKSLGFSIFEANNVRGRLSHMSADGKAKAADVEQLFLDDSVSIILPSVGGHTASQMLPYLNLDAIVKHPKTFISFSDSSLLGMLISERTGMITYHSAVDVMFGFGVFETDDCKMENKGRYTLSCLLDALFEGSFNPEPFSKWSVLNSGTAEGTIIGGNINSIESLLGTPYEPDWHGKILFFESCDALRNLYRTITHISNAGILNKISGLLIGNTSRLMEDFYAKDEIMPIDDMLRYLLSDFDIPIVYNANIGHDVENIVVPMGAAATLSAENGVGKVSFHLR